MPIINVDYDRPYVCLNSPTVMPQASAFLWNKHMMIQMSCRGYATAQFMQPEPAKYSHAPNMEATSFMQPEQPYYTHHPGRFFYVKDEQSKALFSAPYEPVRSNFDTFKFIVYLCNNCLVCGREMFFFFFLTFNKVAPNTMMLTISEKFQVYDVTFVIFIQVEQGI